MRPKSLSTRRSLLPIAILFTYQVPLSSLWTFPFSKYPLYFPCSKHSISCACALIYLIQLFSKHRHVLLLTWSCTLHLRLWSPHSKSLSDQFRTSRNNPQVLYHSRTIIGTKAFKSASQVQISSVISMVSPHCTARLWMYAPILVSGYITYCSSSSPDSVIGYTVQDSITPPIFL